MTTFLIQADQSWSHTPSYEQIEAGINTLGMEDAETVLPGEESPADPIGKAVTIFLAVKPLLVAVSQMPILPKKWRTGLTVLIGALQAVADGLSGPSHDFKTGMDL